MKPGAPANQWLFQDLPIFRVTVTWIVCGIVIWICWPDSLSLKLPDALHRSRPRMQGVSQSAEPLYVGSIIFVPAHGDRCWKRLIDNRTGLMWDDGIVKCDAVAPPPPEEPRGMGIQRLRAIGAALQHAQSSSKQDVNP